MAAQNLESAPSAEQTLRDKYHISDEPEGQEPEGSESAPASEPDIDPQDRKPLTDDEKAERKRRNDERRERRWFEERGEIRARMRQLEEENERLRQPAEKREVAAADDFDFEAHLDTHLKSGKFKTYEAALAATNKEQRQFDREQIRKEMRQEVQTEREQSREEGRAQEDRRAFDKGVKEFSKTHEDFDEVFSEVASALDSRDKDGKPVANAVSRAIVTSKNGAQLAYHIGTHPELLDELQELLETDPEAARDRVIEIRASLKREAAPGETTKTTTGAGRGKSTTRIAGRGSAGVTASERKEAAATKGDFAAFSAANGSKRNW